MSITISFRGVNYVYSEPGDAFQQSMTDFANAIGTNLGTSNPYLEATTGAGQSIPNSTATIVVFGTVATDTETPPAYNAGTGRYTVPVGKGGRYLMSATIQWNAAGVGAGSNQFALQAFKNAALATNLDNEILTPGTTFAALNSLTGSSVINCVPGDVLDARAFQSSGGAIVLSTTAALNRLTIARLQG